MTLAAIRGIVCTACAVGIAFAAAAAWAGPDGEPRACADRVVLDWADGRIDGTYSAACYTRALRKLPTDLRIYSSAADDIREARRNALQSRSLAAAQPSVLGVFGRIF